MLRTQLVFGQYKSAWPLQGACHTRSDVADRMSKWGWQIIWGQANLYSEPLLDWTKYCTVICVECDFSGSPENAKAPRPRISVYAQHL